jgi:hypothetical protein
MIRCGLNWQASDSATLGFRIRETWRIVTVRAAGLKPRTASMKVLHFCGVYKRPTFLENTMQADL